MTTTSTTAPQHVVCFTNTIAVSQVETVLLSSSGDVLVSRCRSSPYKQAQPYQWQDDVAMVCCEAQCDDLNRQVQETTLLCSPGALLGGSPAAAISPVHDSPETTTKRLQQLRGGAGDEKRRVTTRDPPPESFQNRAQKAFSSPPLVIETDMNEEESIAPIKSFDYSHFAEGGNDMLPPPNTRSLLAKDPPQAASPNKLWGEPAFSHGVPTFFPAFSQVKITHVSAHPLGSHCLFISNAGLLYSYGLNNYGQLGIGLKPRSQGSHFVPTPTIVTPLVENGGKAFTCAAGVTHSLVVVVTEERRLLKSDSSISSESVVYHQLYGFGRNDFMKIGLVSPKLAKPGSEDEMENVLLPRRASLRCKVRPGSGDAPAGVFSVQASIEHSAALVRRGSGDVELYTWGNAMKGALGLPNNTTPKSPDQGKPFAIRVVPVPSFVAALSRTSNAQAKSSCVLLRDEFPTAVSLGPRCSFVTTSEGRCFSFGESQDGMLGLGKRVRECPTPSEIALSIDARNEFILQVRAGANSVVATTRSGKVLAWGSKQYVGLGGGDDAVAASESAETDAKQPDPVQWSPKLVQVCNDDEERTAAHGRIVLAVAGFDNAVFVTESGRVLSCGKASGRLGVGEVRDDVVTPQHMFGGLSLWQTQHPQIQKPPPPPRRQQELRRGKSVA